ncbi:hypothetical protein LWI28_010886 [Acer negundo]|uniref:Uncharacterized protein n=1 Tax=Acer negundo TaxID=4023 RepID=A0AAD5IE72_ACENE|nr:hypothetical protein LWI28_010886 [Acer negundo]
MDEQQQIVSPIVKILLHKLQSLRKQNVPLGREGVNNIELERLETILSSFRAVLLDAEKQQLHNNDVRGWLNKLKDACYDAEDTLEELEMEQSRSITGKVCDFISCSKSPANLRFTIENEQIKVIRERLDAIKVDVSKFSFKDRVHHDNGNVPREREIIAHLSFVVTSDVFGRYADKENIIDLLIPDELHRKIHIWKEIRNVSVDGNIIHISGPSGIGKTTLAKMVYKDKRIDETFDIKMWFPNVRVLDFRNSDMKVLPESIGKLKHLRYLNLTKNIRIKRLPKSISMLASLETLLLGGCKLLEELPRDIRLLVNLRMLVFSSKQRRLPKNGIGCLTSLRRLGIGSCYNLKYLFQDIGRLQALRTLIIRDCPKLLSLPSAVKDLSSLETLMLLDCEKNAKCNLKMDMKLQNIKPHLRMLCIDGLPEFNELPPWLLQCSANTLQWLAIKNCPNFQKLPTETLQILKSLEVLEIWNCPKFSSLPEDIHGLTATRELKVRDCPYFSWRCRCPRSSLMIR